LSDANNFTGPNNFATTTVASSSITNANITNLSVNGTVTGLSLGNIAGTNVLAYLANNQAFTGLNTFSATTTMTSSTIASTTITTANIGTLTVGSCVGCSGGGTGASSTLLADSNTFSGANTFTGNTTFGYATSTALYASILGLNGSYFTNLLGTGLTNSSGALTVTLAPFSTTNLAEGSNLYYTDARVGSYISGSSTIPHIGGTAYGNLLYWTGSAWATMATSGLNVNLANTTGNLPVTALNSGTNASNATFYRGDGTWSNALTSVFSVGGLSTFTSGFISNSSSTVTGRLQAGSLAVDTSAAIGTTLSVGATTTLSSAILASGTTGGVGATGAGTRLMWIPNKAAFRAGAVLDDVWDPANIGQNSFAFGEGSKASAANTYAAPYYNVATAARCAAFGSGASCSGVDATAVGQNAVAGAQGTTAIGRASQAQGQFSVAVGYQNYSEGIGATTIGAGGYNQGDYSTLIGLNSTYLTGKTVNLPNTFVVMGGNSTFGSSTINSHVLNVSASTTSGGIVLIKGIASQTGNYFDVQNNSATSLFKIDSNGLITVGSGGLTVNGTATISTLAVSGNANITGTLNVTATSTFTSTTISSTTITRANINTLVVGSCTGCSAASASTVGGGTFSKAINSLTDITIAHGMGKTPSLIKFDCPYAGGGRGLSVSNGYWTASGQGSSYAFADSGSGTGQGMSQDGNVVHIENSVDGTIFTASVSSVDATNITLSVGTNANSGSTRRCTWTANY
jgi:Hep_Hag.